ncbi:MAG: hypothetical protein ACLQPD_14270 [Desulfomonilaceae bacterium]
MSREYDEQTDQESLPRKKKINAKEFVAAFREHPDDFHLMVMFSMTPGQLKKIYSALLAKGLLSEYEYNCREKKLVDSDEDKWKSPAASELASLIENPSEVRAELLYSGREKDSNVAKALEELKLKKEFDKKLSRAGAQTAELCPKCNHPKDTSSPDSCVHCGVVFEKLEPSKKSRKFSWRRFGR